MVLASVEWLRSIDVRVENTRIEKYVSDLKQLAHDFETGTLNTMSGVDLQKYDYRMRESLFEGSDLVQTYRFLGPIADTIPVEKFRDLTRGPASYRDEKKDSNRSRNTAFELIVAARFAMSGFVPLFSSNADLMLRIDGTPIVVECKRPQSYGSISSAVRKALKQIDKRANELNEDTFGIVAIDITKSLNPSHRQLVFTDKTHFDRTLSNICNNYYARLHSEWPLDKYPRTIGVLIRVCGLGIERATNRYTYFQEFVLHAFRDEANSKDKIIAALKIGLATN